MKPTVAERQDGPTVSTELELTRRTEELQVRGELLLKYVRQDLEALHPGCRLSRAEHSRVCEALALLFDYLRS